MKPLAVIVLAAGCSRRLGQNKQLVTIDGEALIVRQCRQWLALGLPLYCVLGYQADTIKSELQSLPQVTVIVNNDWSEGLGGSIATATDTLNTEFEHLLFVLGDQWQLNTASLTDFIKASQLDLSTINVASSSQDNTQVNVAHLSPPVIFPQRYYSALSSLQGEAGAKKVLNTYQSQISSVYLPEAFIDLDTPEQLDKFRSIYPK
ncbi:nucleotidyltransferase family protein [Thalassotalea piscium]